MSPGVEHRERDEQVQQAIGGGGATDDEGAERGGGDRHREQRIVVAETRTREVPDYITPECRGYRRGQPERPFAQAEDEVADSLEPVDQDGFVESRFAVQVGEQELAAFEHLLSRAGKGAFVDVKQRCGAKPQEKGK